MIWRWTKCMQHHRMSTPCKRIRKIIFEKQLSECEHTATKHSMMESCNHQYLGSFQGDYVLERTYKRIHKIILEKQSSECEHQQRTRVLNDGVLQSPYQYLGNFQGDYVLEITYNTRKANSERAFWRKNKCEHTINELSIYRQWSRLTKTS